MAIRAVNAAGLLMSGHPGQAAVTDPILTALFKQNTNKAEELQFSGEGGLRGTLNTNKAETCLISSLPPSCIVSLLRVRSSLFPMVNIFPTYFSILSHHPHVTSRI